MPPKAAETSSSPTDCRTAAGPRQPRVFISYAQQDAERNARVAELARVLAADGIAAELDQYHFEEMIDWPRWCEKQLRPEQSDFVLMVCTAEYRRRIQDQVNHDEGRGVFWEGRLIYQALYRDKDNRRYVPVLLDGEPLGSIPDVMQGFTHFQLRVLGRANQDPQYLRLLGLLTRLAPESDETPPADPLAPPAADRQTQAPGDNAVRADALAGIADALNLVPPLCDALAQRLVGHAGAPVALAPRVAERLCPGEGEAFMTVLRAFRAALDDAARVLRQRGDDPGPLADPAHDILGWMVVTAVLDGYGTEEAPAVRAWFQGRAFHVPIGRSVCLEVLSARWLKRAARFGLERSPHQTGEDDISPEHPAAIGFDDPYRIGPGVVVEEVWRLVYQRIYARTAPPRIDEETRVRLRRRLDIQFTEQQRRLRLVLDPSDLKHPLGLPGALAAVGQAIPRLHLIVVGAGGSVDQGVFLLSAGELAADIEECLEAIARLRRTPGQTTRANP